MSDNRTEFIQDLTSLINKHSIEGESNTPDFILAEYLYNSLLAYEEVAKTRDQWYGKSSWNKPKNATHITSSNFVVGTDGGGAGKSFNNLVEQPVVFTDEPSIKYWNGKEWTNNSK